MTSTHPPLFLWTAAACAVFCCVLLLLLLPLLAAAAAAAAAATAGPGVRGAELPPHSLSQSIAPTVTRR